VFLKLKINYLQLLTPAAADSFPFLVIIQLFVSLSALCSVLFYFLLSLAVLFANCSLFGSLTLIPISTCHWTFGGRPSEHRNYANHLLMKAVICVLFVSFFSFGTTHDSFAKRTGDVFV
jgi:hypothetical protein